MIQEQSQSRDRVYITRDTRGETVGGRPRADRVYVTGPWFGAGIYSSTEDEAEATRFERAEAERLIALGTWASQAPRVEEVGSE